MKKKLFIAYSAVLLLFNQFIYVLDASAVQAAEYNKVQMELEENRADSSLDLDNLYPINANTSKWKTLETEEERFEKTQIEQPVLQKMNTDTLLEAALKSPMLYTVENSADRAEGAMTFLNKMNAGKELLARKDIKEAVLKEYLSLEIPDKTLNDYSKINNCSSEDLYSTIMELLSNKEFSENVDKDIDVYYRIHFLEGVILSDELYPTLSVEEKRELYNKSLLLNEAKQKSEVFSYNAEDSFTQALMEDEELAENVVFPKMKKKVTIEKVYVYTPNGKAVPALKYSDNHVNSSAVVSDYQQTRPEVKIVGAGYSRNNCHAYTWPGGNDVWMKNPGAFISDGSYQKVNSNGRATANYQKVNGNGMTAGHSAIVINYLAQNQRVRTKTDGSPVYDCDLKDDFEGRYDIYKRVC